MGAMKLEYGSNDPLHRFRHTANTDTWRRRERYLVGHLFLCRIRSTFLNTRRRHGLPFGRVSSTKTEKKKQTKL